MRTRHLNGLLIVGILVISTAPLYAQREQQNVAKLKADARNLVGIIGSDKTKTQTYCQIYDLSEQLLQASAGATRTEVAAALGRPYNALCERVYLLHDVSFRPRATAPKKPKPRVRARAPRVRAAPHPRGPSGIRLRMHTRRDDTDTRSLAERRRDLARLLAQRHHLTKAEIGKILGKKKRAALLQSGESSVGILP